MNFFEQKNAGGRAGTLADEISSEISSMRRGDTLCMGIGLPGDLYSPFDLSPVRERSLSDGAEAFLLGQLDHMSEGGRLCVRVVARSLDGVDPADVAQSVTLHFRTRAEEQLICNTRQGRKWWRNLLFGFLFLAAMLVAAHVLNLHAGRVPFFSVLSESLGIVGWVALWEPATYFLYGRKEGRELLHKLVRLSRADVVVTEGADEPAVGN